MIYQILKRIELLQYQILEKRTHLRIYVVYIIINIYWLKFNDYYVEPSGRAMVRVSPFKSKRRLPQCLYR